MDINTIYIQVLYKLYIILLNIILYKYIKYNII